MSAKRQTPAPVEPRVFTSVQEIDAAIKQLERRVRQLQQLDVRAAILESTGAHDVAASDVRKTIVEVYGQRSPEFQEHEHLSLWPGVYFAPDSDEQLIEDLETGRRKVIGIVEGLTANLREKREDLDEGAASPTTYFDDLNLHPRIVDISRDLFLDGHHWDAVFAASKALVNYVKEKSGLDLDGAKLMRTAFSKNSPVLAFNEGSRQTEQDEQEGMMHWFEGAVLAIRNPGGHGFPEGPEQRAIEYISLISLLAYRVQEAKRRKM